MKEAEENPYRAVDVDDTRSWWSGVPLWLRRFVKVCSCISLVLIVLNAQLCCAWWTTIQGQKDRRLWHYRLQDVVEELLMNEDEG